MKAWVKQNPYLALLAALALLVVLWVVLREIIFRKMKQNVQNLTTSSRGLDLIKGHEALRLRAYDDKQPHLHLVPGNRIIGTLTIGYGHTGHDVYAGQETTKAQAEAWLKEDVKEAERIVKRWVEVPLTQYQFDALVSFTYNTGAISETIKRMVNEGASEEEFKAWYTSHYISSKGEVMNGLIRRRKEEAELYWS